LPDINMSEISRLRQEIYVLFSNLLYEPDSEVHKELKRGYHLEIWQNYQKICRQWEGCLQSEKTDEAFSLEVPDSWQDENLPSLNEWKKIWQRNLDFDNPKIKLIESVYKPWTVDESCQMPFAEEKGYIMGDWAHHMLYLYELLDFEPPEDFSYCPDHLILELEFMSLLVEEADASQQRQFINQHLDWLDDLIAKAAEKEVATLYLDLLGWIRDYIASDRTYLAGKVDEDNI